MSWQAYNNGSGKRIWFLSREVDGVTEYHWSKIGRLIRYKSFATAKAAAARLNGKRS